MMNSCNSRIILDFIDVNHYAQSISTLFKSFHNKIWYVSNYSLRSLRFLRENMSCSLPEPKNQ